MKKQAAPAKSGPDAGPWVDLGNGRSRSASTGKMRYDPNADPAYRDAIKRIQAQEQAAAAKASSAANQRALSIVGSVVGGYLGSAGCAIGSYSDGCIGGWLDSDGRRGGDGAVFDAINQVPVTTEVSAWIALKILERREFRDLVWFGENKLAGEKKA